MTRPSLSVRPRTIRGKEVAKLRRAGTLPGVVYGAGQESMAIAIDAREFDILHRQTGRNAVVDLHLDGARPQPVLLHAIQEHPVTRRPVHIDFLAVNMEEERTIDVPVMIVGESSAVDRDGGVLLHFRDTILVRAKPDDIPTGVELDISSLVDFEHVLHASDLQMPTGVSLVTEETEPLARVQAPRLEEAEAAAEAPELEATEGGQAATEGEPASSDDSEGSSES